TFKLSCTFPWVSSLFRVVTGLVVAVLQPLATKTAIRAAAPSSCFIESSLMGPVFMPAIWIGESRLSHKAPESECDVVPQLRHQRKRQFSVWRTRSRVVVRRPRIY